MNKTLTFASVSLALRLPVMALALGKYFYPRSSVLSIAQHTNLLTPYSHWFGDNRSIDSDYRLSISQMIQWVSMFQMPMVGSDVCGFNYDTNPTLCTRWAVLGSWNPFYRNHAEESTISQEFYRWPQVAAAARKAIATRYRLLDYTYTNFYRQTQDGTPMLSPLLWQYPEDPNTFSLELQFFAGDAFLVSPVTTPAATSVEFYVPKDTFYDFDTYEKIEGTGTNMTRDNVALDEIPVLIRAGNIVPMRVKSSYTTTELRSQDFELIIAPDTHGTATGYLYLDDGDTLDTHAKSYLKFQYEHGTLQMNAVDGFRYDPKVKLAQVTVLGASKESNRCAGYDADKKSITQKLNLPLTRNFNVNPAKGC
jgi:alpha-glucosidase